MTTLVGDLVIDEERGKITFFSGYHDSIILEVTLDQVIPYDTEKLIISDAIVKLTFPKTLNDDRN